MFELQFEPPKTPQPTRDWCCEAGARALKAKIEDYWAERGHHVQIMLHSVGFHPAIRAARFDLRSNLKNGFPAPSPQQLERAA